MLQSSDPSADCSVGEPGPNDVELGLQRSSADKPDALLLRGRSALCASRRCAGSLSAAAATLRVMVTFAVRLVHGPGWDASRPIRRQDAWDDHAAFMDALVEDGFIILGGPVGDGEQTLHLVEAEDEQEIRARLAQDPWASDGLLQVGTIERWELWLDSRKADSGR
jgi:uncharacterized protein YciI